MPTPFVPPRSATPSRKVGCHSADGTLLGRLYAYRSAQGPSGDGWLSRAMRNAVGMLLSLSWLGFLIGNLILTNGRHYRLRPGTLTGDVLRQARWYAFGIFRGEPHPFVVSAEDKLNALQKLSYLVVMLLLMPVAIGSGWAFFFSSQLPETLFGMGGVWVVAMIHLSAAWLLILFLVVQVSIITTGETLGTNLRAMLTGWHRATVEAEDSHS